MKSSWMVTDDKRCTCQKDNQVELKRSEDEKRRKTRIKTTRQKTEVGDS